MQIQFKDSVPPIERITDETEYARTLVECSKSCVAFCDKFLALETFDYNKPFLDCTDRFIVYRSGRQVGKSRGLALKALWYGYFAPLYASNLDEGVCNVVIASLSKDQAYLIFNKISNFAHKSPSIEKTISRETKTEMTIRWFDGSGKTNFIVRAIGDTGEGLRGFTAHMVILDEAAYIPESVFESFLPSAVTTKPMVLLTSTPKGKSGMFFQACERSHTLVRKGQTQSLHKRDSRHKWTQFHSSTYDNPLAATDRDMLELIQGTTKASEKQELLGEFIDSGNAIISYNLLQEANVAPKKRPEFEYFDAGLDTSGKGNDETVLMVVGVTPNRIVYPVDCYVELTTDQILLADKVAKYDATYNFRRLFYDETGMGITFGDIAKNKYSQLQISGVNFKTDKTNLYVNLERLYEKFAKDSDRRLINHTLLEQGHRDKLNEQLSYMYWEHGKFKDQKEKARSDNHDDYSDALALACFGQLDGPFMQDIPNFWTEEYSQI